MGVLIQAQIENVSTRNDGTIKLTLGTQELNKETFGELFDLKKNIANVYISANQIMSEAMSEIDNVSIDALDSIKSPAQRLKAVLFINFKQNNEGFKTFDTYYLSKLETIITHYKSKLNE